MDRSPATKERRSRRNAALCWVEGDGWRLRAKNRPVGLSPWSPSAGRRRSSTTRREVCTLGASGPTQLAAWPSPTAAPDEQLADRSVQGKARWYVQRCICPYLLGIFATWEAAWDEGHLTAADTWKERHVRLGRRRATADLPASSRSRDRALCGCRDHAACAPSS
jgi:hypothetical protein